MKKIILAKSRGFCNGVRKALELLDHAVAAHKQVYVLNEIVHNKPIIANYQAKGVKFIKKVSEAPEGSTLVYSAHGVSPKVRVEAAGRKLKIIDATCPLVEKVHKQVKQYVSEGAQVIYIGHPKHEEVIGVYEEAPEHITIIENEKDLSKIPAADKYAIISQTTLSVPEVETMITQIRKLYPNVHSPKLADICYATTTRQESIKQIAEQSDAVIIFGSQNSSNSKRLQEIAASTGKPAYLVDTVAEIDPSWLNVDKLGISAGASAPEYILQECLELLKTKYGFSL